MRIIVEGWPTMGKELVAEIVGWLREQHPGTAVIDAANEEPVNMVFACPVILVDFKDDRTPDDIARGAH